MSYKTIQIKTIQDNGNVSIDMPNDPSNPCKTCGACCSHFRVSFYQGELDSNGGIVPNELVTSINPFMVAMKGTESGGRCNSLIGELGKDISCGIYENRSSSCRSFPVWLDNGQPNPKCQELRLKNGFSPISSLIEL